jgi:DNA-directed RNA polymerase specialized sigma24 family protein
MGDTERSIGEPNRASAGCARPGCFPRAPRGELTECGAELESAVLAELCDAYYAHLVRVAALLTGDADVAQAVAVDSMIALVRAARAAPADSDALQFLYRQVVVRSRRARRYHRLSGGERHGHGAKEDPGGPAEQRATSGFASLPMVHALRSLRRNGREAVVLTIYLDLSEQQAAAIARVSQPALHHHLVGAMRELDAYLPPQR